MKQLIYIFFVITLFSACTSRSDKEIDTSAIDVKVKIKRLEQELFSLQSKESVKNFLDNNQVFTKQFLQAEQYPHDSLLVNSVYQLVTDTSIHVLLNETREEFADLRYLEQEFTDAFKHIKYYYPDFKVPQIQTVVTGLANDMYVSDSLIIISLDFFLGDSATYRPQFPQYVLKRYRKEYIVPSVILLLSKKYNLINPADRTLLGEMIFYGKAFEFTKYMMPSKHDSLIIGYTGDQLAESDTNRNVIWGHFIEKKLLYETSHFIKIKYVDERPYTAEIGSKAPGAIGRWLGWEIVKAYMQEEKPNLQNLMKNQDAQRIFTQSKYKGKS
ncbi:gliding motility lipoprotein GldB [Rhodocytophaga rosea]|uniref:Gliding motility lipoprotein GldB n=1 Tax=Rhodocytophaga rosea TaxID=2704465 RepID=A0A6C0GH08_9BACT|nr:gliding motility lipoprotein GldB [Rhodocytophaga rosea]QHT67165.1 gliding motility lipoprotein GldB [Rhodocytophaga rosea]